MQNVNRRKRAEFERRVYRTLTEILNDPEVMPNADCDDLVVSADENGRALPQTGDIGGGLRYLSGDIRACRIYC